MSLATFNDQKKKKTIKNTLKSLFSDNIHIATKKLFVNLLTYIKYVKNKLLTIIYCC